MDKIKLKWEIFTFLLGFCVLLLGILWLFQTVFLHDMYKFIRKSEINNAIDYVEKNINNKDLITVFMVLAIDKEILVTPTNEFIPPQRPVQESRRRAIQETITQSKEFTLQDGRTLSLTFHAIITPVEATVTTLQAQLYIITGIMIFLSVILAIIIARRVSKPIEALNKSAKSLAGGDYEIHFKGKGFLEIKELSDTLNTAATELSKVDNLRRELMANVSHDMRTPLSLIYSHAEMMHDFPDEITREQTLMIMDETKRLTSLVNDVLDISKLDDGMQELNLLEFNLTEVIRQTTKHTSELVKKDGYVINFEYDNDRSVLANEVKITQVYYNLLINALNHCGKDKLVSVRQSTAGERVTIEVSDNGDGIAQDDLPYIWDRYYKVDKNHKRSVTGTGLGLSIVKKILDAHGAEYGVNSEINKGSTFWFRI